MMLQPEPLIDQMLPSIQQALLSRGEVIEETKVIGIHTGGVWVAEQIHQRLGVTAPLGSLNISFYRDDFTRIGVHPQVNPSQLPFDVNDKAILLVDDVLYTGRTIRAALNEIFDYGRPKFVMLVVLVDRGGRELPIQADVVGKSLSLSAHQHIKLLGPAPLQLVMRASN